MLSSVKNYGVLCNITKHSIMIHIQYCIFIIVELWIEVWGIVKVALFGCVLLKPLVEGTRYLGGEIIPRNGIMCSVGEENSS